MSNVTLQVDLNLQQLKTVVSQLSPKDKLELNEVIWDEKMDIPLSHQKLVTERIKKSKKNRSRMVDWDKASKLLRG